MAWLVPQDHNNGCVRRTGAHSVAVLVAASEWVDSFFAGNQNVEQSFMHAMRDGVHGQSIEEAEEQTNGYITSELDSAVDKQIAYESAGGTGNSDAALTNFGQALHTVTDRTGPEHSGYQPWCLVCLAAVTHRRHEERSARSSNGADEEARYMAHVEAARLWKRYQDQLAAERKKRQKQEQCEQVRPCSR